MNKNQSGNEPVSPTKSDTRRTDRKRRAHNLRHLPISVLLVEDNSVNQMIISRFLRTWGMKVDLASDGKLALEMIQHKKYQLVLMDIVMPEMDGYEAARNIRALEGAYFKDIPIIALTAIEEVGVRDKVLEAGMNELVTKSFIADDLHHTILLHVLRLGMDIEERVVVELDPNLFSDGDAKFRHKLAELLVTNLDDLHHALHQTLEMHDATIFQKVCHRSKSAIMVILNPGFADVVREICDLLTLRPWSSPRLLTLENKFWKWSNSIKEVVAREVL